MPPSPAATSIASAAPGAAHSPDSLPAPGPWSPAVASTTVPGPLSAATTRVAVAAGPSTQSTCGGNAAGTSGVPSPYLVGRGTTRTGTATGAPPARQDA